ncbi:MAG: twin-arginine translocation pathway signal protein, partial [Anaerolineae bacterium]|nr:twin-arginine translocation pathway signal protein [Anaerolineae bacterium]
MKYFRRFLLIALFGVLVFGTIFSAQAQDRTVVIGFTASQSGRYNVESTRQINGLNLWLNQVNEAGGITLSDGTV